jgi:lipoprotein signal peptidase
MDAFAFTVFIAAHAIVACALFLVFHKKYEDGLIGRVALLLLAGAAMVFLHDGYEAELVSVLPATALGAAAFAVFLARHTWRFWRWERSGAHAWTSPQE